MALVAGWSATVGSALPCEQWQGSGRAHTVAPPVSMNSCNCARATITTVDARPWSTPSPVVASASTVVLGADAQDENEASPAGRGTPPPALLPFVQPGRDPSARAGACSVARATAQGRLLAGASQVIGKRPRGCIVGAGTVPEFIPKHNSADIGNHDQTANDAARLDIGEQRVLWLRPGRALLCIFHEHAALLVPARAAALAGNADACESGYALAAAMSAEQPDADRRRSAARRPTRGAYRTVGGRRRRWARYCPCRRLRDITQGTGGCRSVAFPCGLRPS